MEEREQKKLTKMLTKWGVAPDEMDEFLKEYYASLKEDDPKEEPKEGQANESDPNAKANAEKEEPKEGVPAEENGKDGKTEPEERKPEEGTNEPNGNEAKTENQAEGDGNEKEEAPASQDGSKEDEYKKAIEGVNDKIDGLVDALTKAGILTQEKPQVGVDGKNLPANDVGKGTQSALDIINKGRNY